MKVFKQIWRNRWEALVFLALVSWITACNVEMWSKL